MDPARNDNRKNAIGGSSDLNVNPVDAVPLHVEQGAERAGHPFTVAVGDARRLEQQDSSFDTVLLLGPLYHLIERAERVQALAEAERVVRPTGIVAASAISRFASLIVARKRA